MYPGAPEVCDGIDQDCDGQADEGTTCVDDDGDGFCEADCRDGGPDGDCDDTFPYTYPGAVERFDWRDNDCDGAVEDPTVSIELAWLTLDGPLGGAEAGSALDGGGDLNGDGIDDVIIGAPGYDATGLGARRGAAVVVHGRTTWQVGLPLPLKALNGAYALVGAQDGAEGGAAVALLGDVNGDGLSDFAVGAPRHDPTFFGVTLVDAGTAYLFLGRESGWEDSSLSSAVTRLDGLANHLQTGTALSGGDLNGDGLADLVIGAPNPNGDSLSAGAGWVFIFLGRFTGYPAAAGTSSIFQLAGAPGEAMGRSVAVVGHQDSLGKVGLAIGGDRTSSREGIVSLVTGDDGIHGGESEAITSLGRAHWVGDTPNEAVGAYVDGGVDVDGDCYDDLLVGRGALIEPGDGVAYLILSKDSRTESRSDIEETASVRFMLAAGDACPCAVAAVGDMNGDGLGDFAISTAAATVNGVEAAGRVYLFYGRDGGGCSGSGGTYVNPWPSTVDLSVEADATFYGTLELQRIGLALAGLGDVNGDGYDDLGIGAPYFSPTSSEGEALPLAGRVYVQFGAPTP